MRRSGSGEPPSTRASTLAVLLAGLALLPARPLSALDLRHTAARCVLAERFAEIVASFSPPEDVARAVVRFRAEGSAHWYGVSMEPRGAARVGTLPQPSSSIEALEYYIEAVGTDARALRTPAFRAHVVVAPADCSGPVAATAPEAASLLLAAPGAPPFPTGFQPVAAPGADRATAGRPAEAAAPPATTAAEPEAPERAVGREPVATERPSARRSSGSGFPTGLLIGGIAAGGTVGAIVGRGSTSGDVESPAEPSGPMDPPPASPVQEGVQGTWQAQVEGTREVRGAACRSSAAVVFEIGAPEGGEFGGSAMTTALTLEPPGCSDSSALGQTRRLQGLVEGERVRFRAEGPPGRSPLRYEGTVDGNAMSGTVSQPGSGGEGPFEGTWTATRR